MPWRGVLNAAGLLAPPYRRRTIFNDGVVNNPGSGLDKSGEVLSSGNGDGFERLDSRLQLLLLLFEGREALYLYHLRIGPDSVLDLNGLHVYYLDLELGEDASVINGDLTEWDGLTPSGEVIPEPATLLWIVVAAAATGFRRTRR